MKTWKLPTSPRFVVQQYWNCSFIIFLCLAFIKSEKARGFPNLQIKYVRGADPIIKLLDASDIVQEELAIDKWNTDSVEEFLKMHLITDHSVENEL